MNWSDDELREGGEPALSWRLLDNRERWDWFERLWFDVCRLQDRYDLSVRNGWWRNEIALEALAALAAWAYRYDVGIWDDPPGKLSLLYDLERIGQLLRDGNEPFIPGRDQSAFITHMIAIGCEPPEPSSRRSSDSL